jgi:hypothetical protein
MIMFKRNRLALYTAWLVTATLLVWAAVDTHPYSFYMLLRWICCPVLAYSAFIAYETNRVLWSWIFGVLALVYNPIFRTHLDRSTLDRRELVYGRRDHCCHCRFLAN